MKYLKISSLLVLSLLLFAPQALADVECELRPSSQRVRMESQMEMLAALTVRCETEGEGALNLETGGGLVLTDSDVTEAATEGDPLDARSTFDLEVVFSGDVLSGDDIMPPTLWILDAEAARVAAGEGVTTGVAATDADGNRMPAPEATVGSDSVYWEGIRFPEEWDGESRGTFTIAMIYIDASTIGGERLEATVDMAGMNLSGDNVLSSEPGPVSVARVDQALDLSFAEDEKAAEFNACEPGDATISVTLEEGYRMAWMDDNDISLTTSSGKISAKDTGIFDVTGEGGAGELVIDVEPTSGDDSGDIAIKFEPAAGGTVGDDITLSAMILPARRTDESFAYSAELVVGSYVACTGDTLVFPFISNMGGFDTGVVLVNDSKVDGECSLFWDGVMLTNDDDEVVVADRDMMDVDSKDQTAFILSMQNGGFQGLLSAECSFSSAYGYAYITDTSGTGAQGYLAEVK